MTKNIMDEANPKTIRKLRVILYLRVSTDEQAETGRGLKNQIRECLKYVKDHDFVLVGNRYVDANTGLEVIESDCLWKFANPEKAEKAAKANGDIGKPIEPIPGYQDDYSGTVPIEQRPRGSEVYAMLKDDEADAVIAFDMTRLVRPPEEGDEYDMPNLIRGLAKTKKEIHLTTRGKLGTSFGDLLLAMLDAKNAGDENRTRTERCRNGRNDKAEDGKVGITGSVPYGIRKDGMRKEARWNWDDGITCPHGLLKSPIAVVRQVWDWYYSDKLGLEAIANELEGMGAPPPRANETGSKVWHYSSVRKILINEVWAGRTYWGKTRVVNGKQVEQPHDKWTPIDVPHLAIVSREVFDAVQARLAENIVYAKRNGKWDYLLTGFSRCGVCDAPMVGNSLGSRDKSRPIESRRHSYICSAQNHGREEHPRPNRYYHAEKAQFVVWEWIEGLVTNPARLEAGLDEMEQRRESETAPIEESIAMIVADLAANKKAIDRLTGGIADEEDEIVRESFEAQLEQKKAERKALTAKRDRLEAKLQKVDVTLELKDRIRANAARIRSRIASLTFQQQRELLRDLRLSLVFHYNEEKGERWIQATCEFHPEPERLSLERAEWGSSCKTDGNFAYSSFLRRLAQLAC